MIPVLDWRQFETDQTGFVTRLARACRDTGFFLLTHHGIPDPLLADVFDQADRFFALPEAEKARVSLLNNPHYRGWGKSGEENLDDSSTQQDSKETFNIGLDLSPDDPRVQAAEPFRGVNQWPDLPGFSDTLLTYYKAAFVLGLDLHRAFALDLGLPEQFFTPKFADSMSALRLLNYPPATGAKDEIGAGAHSDYGSITLLMTDGEPGLQVRPRGQGWVDVPKVDGAFVVNIGDCLMRWTNDIYVSTPHRVLAPAHRRRSVAMFVEANPNTVIEALPGTGDPKYPAIKAADYLMSRLTATYKSDGPK